MESKKYTKSDIIKDLKNLGINEGDILNVKISFKSIGEIEGGATAFVEALIESVGESGTIVSDAFVKTKMMIPFTGNTGKLSNDKTPSYAGVIANTMLKHPKSKRSPHPVQKFVAIGKNADIVLKHDIYSSPYSVLYEMCKLGAKNIRIGPSEKVVGVGTTHVAIDLLGYEQNIFKSGIDYNDEEGKRKTFITNWPTGCRRAFNNLLPEYKNKGGIICESKVGNASAMLTDMNKTLQIELDLGKKDSEFIFCDNPACYKCRLTWKHSTGNTFKVLFANIKTKNLKNIFSIIYLTLFKNYQPVKKS